MAAAAAAAAAATCPLCSKFKPNVMRANSAAGSCGKGIADDEDDDEEVGGGGGAGCC